MTYKPAPNILLMGGPTAGKSYAIASLPVPKFVIDTEGGIIPYRSKFPFYGPDFVVDSYAAVRAAVREFLANPGDAKLIALDSMSVIWDSIVDETDAVERRHGKNKPKDELLSALDIGSWMPAKRVNRGVIADLKRTGVPLIVTSWQKYDNDEKRFKPQAEKHLEHQFDTILRLEAVGEKRFVHCVRDRWLCIPLGRHEKPAAELIYEAFKDWWGVVGTARPRPSEEMIAEFASLSDLLKLKPEAVAAKLKTFGVAKFEDLLDTQAQEIITKMRERAAALAASSQAAAAS